MSSSVSESKGKNPVIITKDEDYFIESGFKVFQVEECLFRVPSYLFSKESDTFGATYFDTQPSVDNHQDGHGSGKNDDNSHGKPPGSSEDNPIVLLVGKEDFKSLLKALYPLSFNIRLSLSKTEWISILQLSTRWYMLNLRQAAISELENPKSSSGAVTSHERITLGRMYRISSWLLSGLVDFVTREESITDDEGLDIDSSYPTTAYRLFRAREKRIRGKFEMRSPSILNPQQYARLAVTTEVEILFKDEFDQVRSDEKMYSIKAPRPDSPPEKIYLGYQVQPPSFTGPDFEKDEESPDAGDIIRGYENIDWGEPDNNDPGTFDGVFVW